MSVILKGVAWDHPRGYDPVVATAREFEKEYPGVKISWEKRSLHAFGEQPVEQLVSDYDLIVIDHPHVGSVAKTGCLLALDQHVPTETLEALETQSVGLSQKSYRYEGHHWALAIDAAAQVSAYRPDLLSEVPQRWTEVARLAADGGVVWPLSSAHAAASFFTLAANRGTPCAERSTQLIEPEDGRETLKALNSVAQHVSRDCFDMDPIESLDLLSSDEGFCYCPLLYGFSNYAREGFRDHLVKFSDIPSLGPNGPQGATLGGAGIAISAGCEAVEEAIQYSLYVASSNCQKGMYFEAGGQPSHRDAWEDAEVNDASNGFYKDTRNTIEQSWLRPRHDRYLEFQNQTGNLIRTFLLGESDLSVTLERLEESYQESLK